jgi:propanol-preferring alcohol dehydrogenase
MRAVQLIAPGQPLQLREIPKPQPGPDDVLLRVQAAGICHSDGHYRAGVSKIARLPVTLGHEIAGLVEHAGANVKHISAGDRACVHYLAFCGQCAYCRAGQEQFCRTVEMMGKNRDGGYAEFVVAPGRSVFKLPAEIPFAVAAVMMCSSATSLHALNKARLKPGESVAIFGFGGLGFSALQIARAQGAGAVYAVDVNPVKLKLAGALGAIPIDARASDPARQIQEANHGRGVDVALEVIGLPETMDAAVRSLGVLGRAALVGLTQKSFSIAPYQNMINKEAEVIGVSDHLASELPGLLEMARDGRLQFPPGAIRSIPLDAALINQTLDELEKGADQIRTVIQM